MAEEGVFFKRPLPSLSTIDKGVRDQLAIRETLYSKKLPKGITDPNFIPYYLNGNNSFVKLTSGIDIVGIDEEGAIPDAAHNNTLLGGVLYQGGTKRAGLSSDPFLGADKNGNTGAYNFAQGTSGDLAGKGAEGYVPMPGIISFDVKNRGNSGFSREVSMQVKCFSLEQLSLIEKLYLRPGFKCLVEWGHVVYAAVKEDGGVETIISGKPNTIFTSNKPSPDELKEETIKDKGGTIIKESNHNYDYMIGLIKNYNWTYERDGYIVDIELLGKGAISTFLKEMYGGTEHEEGAKEEEGVEFSSSNESSFGRILERISQADTKGKQDNKEKDNIVTECDMGKLNKSLKKYKTQMDGINELLNTEGDSYEFKAYRAGFSDVNKTAGNKNFNFISMRFLLGMINYLFLERPDSSDKVPEGKFNTSPKKDFYLTFDEHFSIDPNVCLLPQQSGKYGLKTTSIPGYKSEKDQADIMDIQLCTSFLYEEYKNITAKGRGRAISKDKSIGEYLNNVLDKISASMGNINEFVLYNDFYLKKDLGPSRLVDLQVLPRPEGQPEDYKMIIPKGPSSFVTDFQFNSELSNSMLNLIVNQAIVSGTDAGTATSTGLASFNSGIKSRFTSEPNEEASQYAKKRADAAKEAEETLIDQFTKIFSTFKYDQKTVEAAYTNGSALIRKELNKFLEDVKPKRGHIGAKVTLTMIGIGGLKALQYFTLPPEILPASYSDNGLKVGFRIDNVSHEIESNVWYSTIEANAMILSQGKNK